MPLLRCPAIYCAVALFSFLAYAPAWGTPQARPLTHRLEARLLPELARIDVHDIIELPKDFFQDVPQDTPPVLELRMARQVEVLQAVLHAPAEDGAPRQIAVPVEQENGRLRLLLPEQAAGGELHLHTRCVFQEDVDEAPANMDNPGFGVEGVIHPKGAMLLAGSGWHPVSAQPNGDRFHITVRAPAGMLAVTTGTLVAFSEADGESLSVWETMPVLGPLPLAAGWWEVQESREAGVRVLTCLTKDTAALASRYLEASARWIRFYERLHGPYPFAQFLVVENFLPTGYGFPGFTLLGSAVLRLPFIPDTSLRHEIAHCWWGNGVFVDYSQGNWCEGLASYVADYLGEEEKSPDAARDYRLRTLRRYAQLAAGPEDFPLARFASRMSPATQAVGYGKAMFVFHMIRTRLGDEAFWNALRTVYREWLFREAGWEDLRRAFVEHGGWDEEESRRFLQQWIARPGAPVLALDAVRRQRRTFADHDGWQVDGVLTQQEPAYALPVRLEVGMGNAVVTRTMSLPQARAAFSLETPGRPQAVIIDPDAHLFRLLDPQEIPATVDTLKGSATCTAVLGAGVPPAYREMLPTLLAGISQPRARIVEETSLQEADVHALGHRDLLFFGQPETPIGRQLLGRIPALPEAAATAMPDVHLLVMHGDHADMPRGVRGLVHLAPQASAQAVSRPAFLIGHYGRYSVLAFREGQAVFKDTWPPGDGGTVHRFTEE
ncbi:M1 family metallopeptidase [Megalodesulfovibrio gigas]|uniref:M1 family metallopeptidase n=1 Tax=Megalodesulfovibrio gigas TaxID=879 RepID=UPI00041A2821|nr:M1 family aminopeptidase [Megalodesulfovibrio gigas]